MEVLDASDSRLAHLTQWVLEDLGFAGSVIAPASVDASFRRYFRVTRGADSYIVMDAPPDKEDSAPFLKVARILGGMNLNVPIVLARDMERGFLLLSDLGSRQYLDELPGPRAADRLYADALAALRTMQTADAAVSGDLPRYDRALLMREMELMPEWFLRHHLKVTIDAQERSMLDELFASLVRAAASQPAAFVHRDYHSRNLLVTAQDNPGILDFQDAVWGPVTYDLASLLKDCYISWPPARVRAWVLEYREKLLEAGFALPKDAAEFMRWFDLIGLQRHIKVLGIFARLFYRDGKSQYLKDLPRVLDYARDTASSYADTAPFAAFIAKRIDPLFKSAQQRALA
ncbi:MAG: N-acetylmuramate 1-kinase [Gammaproteobacteria bacterium]|jgi:aminoglycoside/choline kinase family phosphotransferase|nr:N-acetylmuramate 1-kinase [Gammaproteobacteria bacterium]